jgi:hypothetical protein
VVNEIRGYGQDISNSGYVSVAQPYENGNESSGSIREDDFFFTF